MSGHLDHCGHVAIIGRPNAGKSTLLNRILGQKISITSRKPQTTRHRILGIKTTERTQVIYVDTPGLHEGGRRVMNRLMNRAALEALAGVDAVLFMVEDLRWSEEEDYILSRLRGCRQPVVLAVNKVDRIRPRERLLPHLEMLAARYPFAEIVPVSARNGKNVDRLEAALTRLLPPGPPLYPEDQITDRSERFLAAELVREKLMRRLGQELPYALTVEIERFSEEGALLRIDALIWVERPAQKAMVIGRQGQGLKEVGRQSRLEMERLFGRKVFLQLWVKVKEKWSDDERALRSLGYVE
ncbi:MAG TPA: GTPase Era [Gammaproteobacteria bacterium]|nr:GTPase Era [Gammaproteobacteria bacterium]